MIFYLPELYNDRSQDIAYKNTYHAVKKLQDNGFDAFFVGGCVRDGILNRAPRDYDVATNARPQQIGSLWPRSQRVGASFGVMNVRIGVTSVDVATFRRDVGSSDQRHPNFVEFTDAKEDALRRDFTVNGLFYDPLSGNLIDYVGGLADLKSLILRTIGSPHSRFQEDLLRPLRGVRFAATYNLSIESQTRHAMRSYASQLHILARERIWGEWKRLFSDAFAPHGFCLLIDSGLLEGLVSHLLKMPKNKNTSPIDNHHIPACLLLLAEAMHVHSRAASSISAFQSMGFLGAYAWLLYKLGQHARQEIRDLCRGLALSVEESRSVETIVTHLVFFEQSHICDDAIFIRRARMSFFQESAEWFRASREDSVAESQCFAHQCLERFNALQLAGRDFHPRPLFHGDELVNLGVPRGPWIGKLMYELEDGQLRGIFDSKACASSYISEYLSGLQGGGVTNAK